MPRLSIGDVVYDSEGIDSLSLRDLVLINQQMTDMGLTKTFADVEQAFADIEGSDDGFEKHPNKYLMTAVVIWIARRAKGEDVTFEQAIDFPVSKLRVLEDPKD